MTRRPNHRIRSEHAPDYLAPLDGRVRGRSTRGSEAYERSGVHRVASTRGTERDERAERDRELAARDISDRELVRRARTPRRPPAPVRDILTPEEEEAMRRATPRPRPTEAVTDEDLAQAIERAWSSRFPKRTVAADMTLAELRRGGAR